MKTNKTVALGHHDFEDIIKKEIYFNFQQVQMNRDFHTK